MRSEATSSQHTPPPPTRARLITAIRAFVVLLVQSCAGWQLQAVESIVTPAMVGRWEGNARIVVSWCQQKNLRVSVDLRRDGTVTGTVGDAILTNARFQRNRGWLARKVNWKTDYIIVGGLDGAVVAAEDIRRARVSMPLYFRGGTFAGGVHTSGSKFGGKERMILSARSLALTRQTDR